jgi:1,4-dihydroxy-2-naphthoate polyprenyltransferase
MHPNILHLRFPFSLFLMPVFLFAISPYDQGDWLSVMVCFFVLHLLVYPSSNGYNSYMDNDTESIGGIQLPPKVPKSMFGITLVMDIAALGISWALLSNTITLLLFGYILASRAYSYRGIRIKKYPIWGFLHVAFFQGVVVYVMARLSMGHPIKLDMQEWLGLLISFLLVGAGYPLTQVYQHKQDREDGVRTISMLLGIKGTFMFSGIMFAILGVAMGVFQFYDKNSLNNVFLFYGCLAPVLVFYNRWHHQVKADERAANFENTMRMNKLGAWMVNVFLILIFIKNFL